MVTDEEVAFVMAAVSPLLPSMAGLEEKEVLTFALLLSLLG
jgi:hypothetical protein